MLDIPVPEKKQVFDGNPNSAVRSVIICDCDKNDYLNYCDYFEKNGGVKKETDENAARLFSAFLCGECGVFINFFHYTRELQIVVEKNCSYFDFCDNSGIVSDAVQVTQLYLEDFGMSYVIRLGDGRFVIIDGGREFESDAVRLFEHLKQSSPEKKPVIAAWIMSHPHCDHFHCFFPFIERYRDEVVIEKFLYNFPDNVIDYPSLTTTDGIYEPASVSAPRFEKIVRSLGIPVFMPHTGQRFNLGRVSFEVIASVDDSFCFSRDINNTSLCLMMRAEGQSVLWATDSSFAYNRLAQRYKHTLKSDILQVPHHGFGGGSKCEDALIDTYRCIDPDVCLLPVHDHTAYNFFCIFKKPTLYLFTKLNVKEIISGKTTRSITLPYTASVDGEIDALQKIRDGYDSVGCKTWVFSELNTDDPDSFVYSMLNITAENATVTVELYFEMPPQRITSVTVAAERCVMKTVNIIDKTQVETGSEYNTNSLDRVCIPKNAKFAVRFLSDVPIIISNKKYRPVYKK